MGESRRPVVRTPRRCAYLGGFALLGYALLNAPALWPAVLQFVVAFWVLAAVVVLTFPASGRLLIRPVLVPAGYVAFVGAWLALVALFVARRSVVDSVGADRRLVGRHRRVLLRVGDSAGASSLLLVSPGKTWEGAIRRRRARRWCSVRRWG